MVLGTDTEKETLKSLFKACLLELDKVKTELSNVELKQNNEEDKLIILDLQNQVSDKENEIEYIKSKFEEEMLSFKDTIQAKEDTIIEKDNKIYELKFITNSLDEIKESFADQLRDFKKNELIEVNEELDKSKTVIAQKDAKIKILEKELDDKSMVISNLGTALKSNEHIASIQSELDKTKEEIYKKENEINLLKESSVSKDEYYKLKEELFKKDDKINKLEEVNKFFNDINDDSLKRPRSLHKDSDE